MNEWIKVCKGTPNKTEMFAAAKHCNVTRQHAFGCWFSLWSWLDDQTSDGYVNGMTREQADEIAALPGLAESLEKSGWLIFDSHGCCIANWDRHNGQSAKRRAMETERKRTARLNTVRNLSASCPH